MSKACLREIENNNNYLVCMDQHKSLDLSVNLQTTEASCFLTSNSIT